MTTFEEKCSTTRCRSCGQTGLLPILDLGLMPLTAVFVSADRLDEPDKLYPLRVGFCPSCTLAQILDSVSPEKIFSNGYPYYSSFSDALLKHSRDNALSLIERRQLDEDSLVVELASNDGYLLRTFVEKGIPCLGIDPAKGPAQAAEKVGVPTLCAFFDEQLAQTLVDQGKQADVIIANNVLAHVPEVNGFVAGMRTLLKNDGVAVIESPYVGELVAHCEFDTIYHEHLFYYSVTALDHLFRRNGLFLSDIEILSIHGGSLRLFVQRHEAQSDTVFQMLAEEQSDGIAHYSHYDDFRKRVENVRVKLNQILREVIDSGAHVAAYGAAAKGTILLNYAGVDHQMIDFVVDRNVHKQGMYVPGVRIPIADPKELVEKMPDYVLLLPWNFKDEILEQQREYREKGGKFIIPIPEPVVV